MKNKIKKFIGLISLTFLMAACSGNSGGKISGKLKNAKGKTVVLEVVENNVPRAIDSASVGDDGSFTVKLPYGRRAFYRLKSDASNMIILCIDSTEEVMIEADALRLYETYKVTGSSASEKIKEFFTNADKIN
jgi:hypothetical protein